MKSGIESLDQAYAVVFTTVLILMAVLAMLCLVRAIIGPRTADRIVSVNMMGTMVIVMIAVLALLLGEGYLVDICLIYAMISFLAVIVLTKVYMGVYLEKKEMEGKNAQETTEGSKETGDGNTHGMDPDDRKAEGGNTHEIEWGSKRIENGSSEGMEWKSREQEGKRAEHIRPESRGLAGGKPERGSARE